MFIDFASENEFEDLARRLFVPCFEQLASRVAEQVRSGSAPRIGAIPGNFGIQSSELRSHPQVKRDKNSRLCLSSFLGQCRDGIGRLRILFSPYEVRDPAHLPGIEILLGVVTLKASKLPERVLLGLQNASKDRRALSKRNPGSVDNIGQNLRGVLGRGGNIRQPRSSGHRIGDRGVSRLQQSVGAIVAIVAKIGADYAIGIGLELGKEVARTQLIARASEVRPETLRRMRAVELPGEYSEGLLPLGDSSRTIATLVVGDRETVIDIGAVGRKVERVVVVGDGVLGVAGSGVVVGQSYVFGGRRRTLLQDGGQKVLGIALFGCAQVFPVARAVVEPGVAGELLRAVDWFRKALGNHVIAKGAEESIVCVRGGLGIVQSNERVV